MGAVVRILLPDSTQSCRLTLGKLQCLLEPGPAYLHDLCLCWLLLRQLCWGEPSALGSNFYQRPGSFKDAKAEEGRSKRTVTGREKRAGGKEEGWALSMGLSPRQALHRASWRGSLPANIKPEILLGKAPSWWQARTARGRTDKSSLWSKTKHLSASLNMAGPHSTKCYQRTMQMLPSTRI